METRACSFFYWQHMQKPLGVQLIQPMKYR